MKLFLCKRSDMFEDSWTYGDWRQYVCKRPSGETQCARFSRLPEPLLIVCGMALLTSIATLSMAPWHAIYMERCIALGLVGGLPICAFIGGFLAGYRLMRSVAPENDGNKRVFNEPNARNRRAQTEGEE